MLRALSWQRAQDQWTKDGGQYIPNPATWLNQKRWEDEKPKGSLYRGSMDVGRNDTPVTEPTREEKIESLRGRRESFVGRIEYLSKLNDKDSKRLIVQSEAEINHIDAKLKELGA
jgi:hypothetical protein